MNRQKHIEEPTVPPKKRATNGSSFAILAETDAVPKTPAKPRKSKAEMNVSTKGRATVSRSDPICSQEAGHFTVSQPLVSTKQPESVPLKSIMKKTLPPEELSNCSSSVPVKGKADRVTDTVMSASKQCGDHNIQLIQKYEALVEMIQHRKLDTYARLLQLLFGCFTIPDEPGPITIRTNELVRILEKTQTKYDLAIQNESMEKVLRIFTAICKKLGGTPEYRLTRITEIESRIHKLYTDSELLSFLYELEEDGVRPDTIQRINSRDEIVLKSNATIPLPVSQKWRDFVDILMRNQSGDA